MPEGIPEGPPENMPCPDEVEHSISVDVLLISSCMLLIVLLKFSVRVCVASWFATMPAGMEIMIAIEKPKAMITKNALIFLLETFLTALVKAPKWFTFTCMLHLIQKRGSGKQSILASFHRDWD
jgi:hypothetical protein